MDALSAELGNGRRGSRALRRALEIHQPQLAQTLSALEERFLARRVHWPPGLSAARQTVLSDAQTSGGLLIATAAGDERRLLDALTARGVAGHVVGELTSGPPGEITVV